jgi:hypothetical protein
MTTHGAVPPAQSLRRAAGIADPALRRARSETDPHT